MQDFETLLVEHSSDRMRVRLNRPETRNAINQQMVDELHRVCAELEAIPKILILRGGDGVFASGADIAELRERTREDALAGINSTLFERIALLPMPVIAVLDGWTLGGGAELAYAADFRLATTRTRIGNPETSLGIIPAAGALWRLAELVGEPLAKEIILAGRVLTADEALGARLVTAVHEPDAIDAAAEQLADRVAANDPLATRRAKAVFHAPRAAHPAIDNETQAELFESPGKFERMSAFLAKRGRS